jgi:hypothetical protein
LASVPTTKTSIALTVDKAYHNPAAFNAGSTLSP